MKLEFTVLGTPGPQGSKSFKGMAGGHAILAESSKIVKPWRDSVMWCARQALGKQPMITGPVVVDMIFTLKKPKSAPKKRRTWPKSAPDLSKLARSTEDALTIAGVYEDDARIVEYGRLAKVFPGEDVDALSSPGCVIRIRGVE
jgi:crossover junction endodeoxyribonuclease RusA